MPRVYVFDASRAWDAVAELAWLLEAAIGIVVVGVRAIAGGGLLVRGRESVAIMTPDETTVTAIFAGAGRRSQCRQHAWLGVPLEGREKGKVGLLFVGACIACLGRCGRGAWTRLALHAQL
jgi:hypothetical protein